MLIGLCHMTMFNTLLSKFNTLHNYENSGCMIACSDMFYNFLVTGTHCRTIKEHVTV